MLSRRSLSEILSSYNKIAWLGFFGEFGIGVFQGVLGQSFDVASQVIVTAGGDVVGANPVAKTPHFASQHFP
jgi:hypothetical protein